MRKKDTPRRKWYPGSIVYVEEGPAFSNYSPCLPTYTPENWQPSFFPPIPKVHAWPDQSRTHTANAYPTHAYSIERRSGKHKLQRKSS